MKVDTDKILEELKILPEYNKQIMLQAVDGQKDPFYGIGRSIDYAFEEKDFINTLFDMPYTNKIIKDLKMFRTRVMKLKSHSCYSYHKDQTPRIHIPLITNDKCFFILDKEIIILQPGQTYYIDTRIPHTALNGSPIPFDRIHIVGCVDA